MNVASNWNILRRKVTGSLNSTSISLREALKAKVGGLMGDAGSTNSLPPFETYESRAPAPQNAIDAVPGWNSMFPAEYGVVAGNRVHFQDERMVWAADRFGDLTGKNVLELGPLDGAHTYQLHQRGANVVAVEANKGAFLRCLITKEIVGLTRANYLLGDCVKFLEENEKRYDLIVACGVLYHMPDPARFLEAVASRTDALYLWTVYFDDSPLPEGDPRAHGFAQTREIREFKGKTLTLYRRNYSGVHTKADFSGGIYDNPRWMIRPDILSALELLGFSSLEIEHDVATDQVMRTFSVFARREPPKPE
jgi:Methyltransferase domain